MIHRSHLSAEERRILSRLHKVLNIPGLMRGNLVQMRRKCGKPGCRCRNGKDLHVSWYVSQSRNGKPHMLYVPKEWEKRVRSFTERHREVRQLLEQLSEIYWERLQQRRE
jgi:hypothetical protein